MCDKFVLLPAMSDATLVHPHHSFRTAYDIQGLESRMNELVVGLRPMQNELDTL